MAGSRLTDRRLPLAAICLFVVAVGLWNAARYPTGAGYDAADHMAYADGLVPGLPLPPARRASTTRRPASTSLAGSVDWVAQELGYGDPDRAGQVLNVLFLLGTVLLVAAIARELWPGRRRIELGAAAFVAFLPVVVETTAMFHPEPMSLFLSTLALWLCVRTFATRATRGRSALTLGAAQLVRAFALSTVGGRRARAARRAALARARDRARARGADPGALVHPPARQVRRAARSSRSRRRPRQRLPASFYARPRDPGHRHAPVRASITTRSRSRPPTTGSGATTSASGRWHCGTPLPATSAVTSRPLGAAPARAPVARSGSCRRCSRSSAGPLFARSSLRDRSRLAVALLPPLAIAGYLYFAVVYWTPDGDLLKATYMLTTTAGWAIGFGYALDRIRGRLWPVTLALLGALRARRAAVPRLLSRVYGRRRSSMSSRKRSRPGLGSQPSSASIRRRVGGDRLRVGRAG